MIGRGRDAIQRAYTGGWGSDARRDRRIDRARRKVVAEREILEVETDEEFEAFLRCGECGGEDC